MVRLLPPEPLEPLVVRAPRLVTPTSMVSVLAFSRSTVAPELFVRPASNIPEPPVSAIVAPLLLVTSPVTFNMSLALSMPIVPPLVSVPVMSIVFPPVPL